MNQHPILQSAHLLSGNTIYVSSNVPRRWRVWLLGTKVIQVAAGDRVIFETGQWSTPQESAVVVVGRNHPGVGMILASMDNISGTHQNH